jgi:hypothetical protein
LLAFAFPHGAAAATAHPMIVSFHVKSSRSVLPASGARVTLTVQVKNAKSCTFYWQHTAGSSIYPERTLSCASGHAAVTVPAIPNARTATVLIEFGVRVKGASAKTVWRGVFLHEAAAAKAKTPAPPSGPATSSLLLSPASLPSAGGTVAVDFTASNATQCTLASTPALWSGPDPMTVKCGGHYIVAAGPTTTPAQWSVVFTATSSTGSTATSTQQLTEDATATPGPSTQMSLNWAGYIFPSSSPITQAAGTWTVPVLDCATTPNGGTSTWVGLGGAGDNTGDLLQTGIETDCANGAQQTSGWWELVPMDPEGAVFFQGLTVSPGDLITASVLQASGGQWETKVDDVTTGLSGVMVTGEGWGVLPDGSNTFNVEGTAAPSGYGGGTTAEWIQEDYTDGSTGNLVPLADFRSVTFSGVTTNASGFSLTGDDAATLVDESGNPLATPLAPVGGTTFSVVYG